MGKETVLAAFCNQKGGVGKSTYTILAASYLHYEKGLNVAVIDCDTDQWSVADARKRDEMIIEREPYYQRMMAEQYRRTGQRIYPVVKSDPPMAIKDYLAMAKSEDRHFDVVLFDLPGTVSEEGVIFTLASLDHLFIPIRADNMVMESAIGFAHIFTDSVIGKHGSNLKSLHLFWTQVDKRERTPLYDQFDAVMRELSLPRFEAHIPDRKRFNKEMAASPGEIFRSTLFPPNRRFARESNLDQLFDEMCAVMSVG